jgi:hypothetical protein
MECASDRNEKSQLQKVTQQYQPMRSCDQVESPPIRRTPVNPIRHLEQTHDLPATLAAKLVREITGKMLLG